VENEERDRLYTALGKLDRTTQSVLRLRYLVEELSQSAVGKRLGLTRDVVRRIERQGLASLRRMLEPEPLEHRSLRESRQVLVAANPSGV
jgi:RNA polymerase sigma factor (sigma-70 family)